MLLRPLLRCSVDRRLLDTLVMSTCWVKYDPFTAPPSCSPRPQDRLSDGGRCARRNRSRENTSSVRRLAVKKPDGGAVEPVWAEPCPVFEIAGAADKYCCSCVVELRGSTLRKDQGSPVSVSAADSFSSGFAARVTARGKKTPERRGCCVGEAQRPHESLTPAEAPGSSELVWHFHLRGRNKKNQKRRPKAGSWGHGDMGTLLCIQRLGKWSLKALATVLV